MRRYISYFKYVFRHKWYVFQECCKHGQIWRGIMHDMSKFLPDEFIPYARFFYNSDGSKRQDPSEHVKEAFNAAWLRHQHRNPHHWQHWVLREDSGNTFAMQMPKKYVLEMVSDWVGAGKAILGKSSDPVAWYAKTAGSRILHPYTLHSVEILIAEIKCGRSQDGIVD